MGLWSATCNLWVPSSEVVDVGVVRDDASVTTASVFLAAL